MTPSTGFADEGRYLAMSDDGRLMSLATTTDISIHGTLRGVSVSNHDYEGVHRWTTLEIGVGDTTVRLYFESTEAAADFGQLVQTATASPGVWVTNPSLN